MVRKTTPASVRHHDRVTGVKAKQPFQDALQTLMDTFWSPQGWLRSPSWPREQKFAEAIHAGVMFAAPRVLSHDEWIAAAVEAVSAIEPRRVETAFLASLNTRRLDLRSALGSYAVARNLPLHGFKPRCRGGNGRCATCGLYQRPGEMDLNVLNFERYKWGGVRRHEITYVAFDLEQFTAIPPVECTAADRDIARRLISALDNADSDRTAAKVAGELTMIKGNRTERRSMLGTLGVCGVLQSGEHTGYQERFIPDADRKLPARRFVDDPYPVCWWTGADGVNRAALGAFLPSIAV